MTDTTITIRLPKDLKERINQKSKATGVSVSFKVRECLDAWVGESISIEIAGNGRLINMNQRGPVDEDFDFGA